MVECKKTHLAVWVGSQYMATCYFPLREEATSPSLTPSTHTPHHRCSASCLFVDLALSSNTIHAHTLWLQIHPRWYLETPNTINAHTLRLQIPYTGIPCDFKYHPRTYLETLVQGRFLWCSLVVTTFCRLLCDQSQTTTCTKRNMTLRDNCFLRPVKYDNKNDIQREWGGEHAQVWTFKLLLKTGTQTATSPLHHD